MRQGHAHRPSKACDVEKVVITRCDPFDYAPVKLFCPHPPPPGQPRGQRKNVCYKKGGALKNEVKQDKYTMDPG